MPTIRSILRRADKKANRKKEKRKTWLQNRKAFKAKQKKESLDRRNKQHRLKHPTKSNAKSPSKSGGSRPRPTVLQRRLKSLTRTQGRRRLLSSGVLQKQQKQRHLQRKRDVQSKLKPKSVEVLKAQKSGDPRQLRGFKSKLTSLEVAWYKQVSFESNEESAPFRDSYFAAKINAVCHDNRSLEMRELQSRVGPLCGSLPHVLLHKEEIFRTIIAFINDEAHKWLLRDAVSLRSVALTLSLPLSLATNPCTVSVSAEVANE